MAEQQGASFFSQLGVTAVTLGKQVFVTSYDLITGPPRYFWGLIALVVALVCILIYASRRWVEAQPNQWLLLIRSGKLAKAGVGLKVFTTPLDTVVTFPSKVERVYFSANNVTVEMQGIVIEGFAFWSVFRDDDGPFRCYKYLQGCDANDSVRALCQSVLRNLIANSTIDEVMKNRNHLRLNMQKELKDIYKGWGIWLESVEITDVRISSGTLFKDLQAEFRQETKLNAEMIQLKSNAQMQETRQISDMKMFEKNQAAQTKKIQTTYEQDLKRKEQEEAYLAGKANLEIQKIKRNTQLEVQRIKINEEKEVEKLRNNQKIETEKQDFEIEAQKRSIEMDKLYDDKSFRKYKIDLNEKIYTSIAVKDLKINQYSADSTLLGVLPLLSKRQ